MSQPTRPPVDETHSHQLPRFVLVCLVVIAVGLAAGIVLVATQAVTAARQAEATDARLQALEEYVAGRGVYRDADSERLDRRITAAVCAVLDQLPAGGRLDDVRQDYRCSPGLPRDP